MAAEPVETISGSAASALLPTAVAATARPAPLKKPLRVSMLVLVILMLRIAEQSAVELRLRHPKIAGALDVVVDACDLAARIGQQVENTDERGVVAQQVLRSHRLADRHHLIALLPRNLESCAVCGIGHAYLGARVDGRLCEAIDSLRVDGLRPPLACTSAVEYRNFQADLIAAFVGLVLRALQNPRRSCVEHI